MEMVAELISPLDHRWRAEEIMVAASPYLQAAPRAQRPVMQEALSQLPQALLLVAEGVASAYLLGSLHRHRLADLR